MRARRLAVDVTPWVVAAVLTLFVAGGRCARAAEARGEIARIANPPTEVVMTAQGMPARCRAPYKLLPGESMVLHCVVLDPQATGPAVVYSGNPRVVAWLVDSFGKPRIESAAVRNDGATAARGALAIEVHR